MKEAGKMVVEDFRWNAMDGAFVPVGARIDVRAMGIKSGRFLKGPIPWHWLERAALLPGKALAVSLCLWRLAGLRDNYTVWLTNDEVATLGVDRFAKSRALRQLENDGLVEVEHRRGRIPLVTIRCMEVAGSHKAEENPQGSMG
jgi:hypothetical protein